MLINQALAEFTQQYPDINIDLVVADHFVDMLEEGFDLAIRTGELADSSLIARRLVDSDWVLVASPEYLRHNGVPQHSRQLQYHNCLTYKYESSGADTWRLAVNGIDYYERVSGNFQANNLLSLKTAVLSGVGIAYLPKSQFMKNSMHSRWLNYCLIMRRNKWVYLRCIQICDNLIRSSNC